MRLIECGWFRLLVENVEDGINIVGHQLTMPSGEVVEEVRYDKSDKRGIEP
jgi:hypothetical protein